MVYSILQYSELSRDISVFLLYCSAPNRYHHSFPTRRSSDLSSTAASSSRWRSPSSMPSSRRWSDSRPSSAPSSRSEEHTSELQSPYDLVCRLLLEKKNYTH